MLGISDYRDSSRSQSFTYDNLNRLTSAQNAGTDCSEILPDGHTKYWGNSYGYDPWGNLINKTITKCGAEHLQAQALANNQLADYGYDAAGNMTNDLTSGMQYHYDAGNMLKTVGSITYWYDNDGQRYFKWNNGVPVKSYFYGSDGEILAEGSGGSTLTAEYIFFNGKRIARVDLPGNAIHYYLSDALNSTSMEVSSAGVIENQSDYYPWGGELKFTANDPNNPYKFTGKERDTETGLDYFGARYYSNGLGRFSTGDWSLTPVPVPYADFTDPQSLNQYSYVRNIPTVTVDADGHDGCCDVTDVIDFAAGIANAYGSDNLGGAGRIDDGSTAYHMGQVVGDGGAVISGVGETGTGVAGEGLGIALDLTGGGALIGVPVNIASAGLIAHGAVTTTVAGANLGKAVVNALSGDKNNSDGSKGGPTGGKKFADSQRAEDAGKKCVYCGKETTEKPGKPNSRETDHICPRCQGGNTTRKNRAPACRTCNRSKGGRTPKQWRKAQQKKSR